MTQDLSTGTLACRAGVIRGFSYSETGLLKEYQSCIVRYLLQKVLRSVGLLCTPVALLEKCRILFFRYFNVLSCLLLHLECVVGRLSEGLRIGL